MVQPPAFELQQVRTFVAVVEHGSFTKAADSLHIAQQAVSQQIKALERTLEVELLRRSSRRVELTPAGGVFLRDCRRLLSSADRAAAHARAAARGEAGSLRLVHTLTTAWDTLPTLLADLGRSFPQLKVQDREVFGGDLPELLLAERCDLALAPMSPRREGLEYRAIRRERMRIAISQTHALASSEKVELSALGAERFEVWPREMAPGFYDTVVGACRAAGFEPELDERAGGNTVWGYIARGRGVALINGSLIEQLPRGIKLVDLADPQPTLTTEAVWRAGDELPAGKRTLELATQLASRLGWL